MESIAVLFETGIINDRHAIAPVGGRQGSRTGKQCVTCPAPLSSTHPDITDALRREAESADETEMADESVRTEI